VCCCYIRKLTNFLILDARYLILVSGLKDRIGEVMMMHLVYAWIGTMRKCVGFYWVPSEKWQEMKNDLLERGYTRPFHTHLDI